MEIKQQKLLIGNKSRCCCVTVFWVFFVVLLSCTCHTCTSLCLQPSGTVNRWRFRCSNHSLRAQCFIQIHLPLFPSFYFVSLFTLCFSMVFRSLALFQKSHYRGRNCVEYVIMEMFLMCWRKPQSLKRGWYVWLYSHEMKAHVR